MREHLHPLAQKIAGFLASQKMFIATKVERLFREAQKDAGDRAQAILDQLGLSDWTELVAWLTPSLQQVFLPSSHKALADLGITGSDLFDQLNDDAIDFARARAAELVGMKWVAGRLVQNPDARWAITDSTRQWLRELITEAFTDGMTPADLAGEIHSSYLFSESRAMMISRTELSFAHVNGALAGWKRSGMVEAKQWILGSEHDEDDECDDYASRNPVPLDGDWDGNVGPPAHPNCVCAIVSVLTPSD